MKSKNFEKKYVGQNSILQQKIKQHQDSYVLNKNKNNIVDDLKSVSSETLYNSEKNENVIHDDDINSKLDALIKLMNENNLLNNNTVQEPKNIKYNQNKHENKNINLETNYNPLKNYFRRPGISIKLPSSCLYYDEDVLNLSPLGELEVYPMTISDEILLKNPDSLSNGSALEKILKSCCPSINKPREIFSCDFDAILLAIRYATYGKDMEIDVNCPSCNSENSYKIDLFNILENMNFLEKKEYIITDQHLRINLRPYSLVTAIKITKFAFEQTKLMMVANNESTPEDKKIEIIEEVSKRVANFQNEILMESIESVETPEGILVTDKNFIKEWIENAPSIDMANIDNKINYLNNIGVDKEFVAVCKNCNHQWQQKISYDPTNFFGKRS